MGQFKPMVKMETTEPSVILKLKKGGHVAMKSKGENGHAPMKKMDGGAMAAMAGTPALIGRPALNAPVRAPKRPSMAARRAAMMAAQRPRMAAPADMPMMKKGGKAEGGDMDKAQDKSMIKKAFKQHDMQEHKGGKGTKLALKKGGKMATGGVALGNAGGFKTGGVVLGAGGFKKGGAAKKFADGGLIDTGRAVSMPQGHKKPSQPISTIRFAGTFKKGGKVSYKQDGGGMSAPSFISVEKEKVTTDIPNAKDAARMRQEKKDKEMERNTNKGYENFQDKLRMKKHGGMC